MMEFGHEVIFCIVNEGFSETVMEAARRAGAGGGTVLRARGTANIEAEKVFGISISPQKEIVMILAPSDKRDGILHSLYSTCGLDTPGHGIAFALPVDRVVGLKNIPVQKPEDSASAGTDLSADNDQAEGSN